MAKDKFTIIDGLTCNLLDLESAIKEMQIDGGIEAKNRVSLCSTKKVPKLRNVRDKDNKMVKDKDGKNLTEPDVDKDGKQKTETVQQAETTSWEDCNKNQKKWITKSIEFVLNGRLKKLKTKKITKTELSDA